ncbi:MAG: RNA polymerase sigma factor (sigma-70 family) [Paraglaciecola sp.]|jgi:RNA polymerase sigma-70 factor (ECF subfamily)
MQKKSAAHTPWHPIFMAARNSMASMLSRIVPPKEIEDIVQETYVRICQMDKREPIEQPKSFLMKTARNLAYDHLKKAETRLTDGVESDCDFDVEALIHDEVFKSIASNEEFAHFCEAVRQLPVQCRRVFVLKKVYGYSQKEIAKEMKLSESTVEKHIAVGFKRCASYMLGFSQTYVRSSQSRSAANIQGGQK